MSLTLFVMINMIDDYYMNNLLMKYYMKVCIYVDDYYMNNLLMNYYMNAYVELTWWLYDVAIKWWMSMRL